MYLVIDLEMCNVKGRAAKKSKFYLSHEIIQIGAVVLDENNRISDEFNSYVKPEYGKLDGFIKDLTGIREEQLEAAPGLRGAIDRLDKWMNGRDLTAASWSEEDLFQLSQEMRQKRIRNHRIEKLFDNWIDMQKSFCDMLSEPKAISLQNALELASIRPTGQFHNGLSDASNTALLFAKIAKQERYRMEMTPLQKNDEEQRLSYTLGELFTQEMLDSIDAAGEEHGEESEKTKEPKERFSIYRFVCRLVYGNEMVAGSEWEKLKFRHFMKLVDLKERFRIGAS